MRSCTTSDKRLQTHGRTLTRTDAASGSSMISCANARTAAECWSTGQSDGSRRGAITWTGESSPLASAVAALTAALVPGTVVATTWTAAPDRYE